MILDDAIADDLRRLGFETTPVGRGDPFYSRETDFFLMGSNHPLVRLEYEFDLENRICAIGHLNVSALYKSHLETERRGHGIGQCITKCFARAALGQDIKEIQLGGVEYNGLSFWPCLGARPTRLDPQRFHRALFNVLVAGDVYSSHDRTLAGQTKDTLTDSSDPQTAWRSIARKELEGGPSTACLARITRNTLGEDRQMLLDLTDPAVLTRLGLTPQPKGI